MNKTSNFVLALLFSSALMLAAQGRGEKNGNPPDFQLQPPQTQRFDNNDLGRRGIQPVQKPAPVPAVQKPGQPAPQPETIAKRPEPPKQQPKPPQPPKGPQSSRPQPPPPPPGPVPQVTTRQLIVPMYNDAIEDELEHLYRRGRTTPEDWTDDINIALQTASKYNRPVLILFTGSDWCYWCKKLAKDVLSRDKFEDFAERNLVLMYVDFPNKKKLPQDLRDDNAALAQQYNVQGYPHSVLINTSGTILGEISGYNANYVNTLRNMMRNAGYRTN